VKKEYKESRKSGEQSQWAKIKKEWKLYARGVMGGTKKHKKKKGGKKKTNIHTTRFVVPQTPCSRFGTSGWPSTDKSGDQTSERWKEGGKR